MKEFEVGTYRELHARSLPRDGLDIHHLIPQCFPEGIIPGYSAAEGICIALRASEHRKIRNLRSDEIEELYRNKSPRQILAGFIWRNRQAGVIPPSVFLKAIKLYLEHYPYVFEKPGKADSKLIDAHPILPQIEENLANEREKIAAQETAKKITEHDKNLRAKAYTCVNNGNRLYSVPDNVRQLLQNNGSTPSTTSSSNIVPGTYIIHEEYDPLLRRNLTLKARIEYVRSETHEEVRGRTKIITTTHYYQSILEWS